ncbi:MAG: metallophosphoesterase family protein [Candidatus Firestonebacteria bacterium]|nr:metallophosphoesterase family protein [Candidatus Firestonebacteria bacterium]
MKYAVIADIHSNIEAFQAVIEEINKEKPDQYLFLGDLVGYGANPNECAQLFSTLKCQAVMGNHDYASLHITNINMFNPNARIALQKTYKIISESTRNLLCSFRLKIEAQNYILVHANPSHPTDWSYMLSIEDAHDNFTYFSSSICFVGHSHVPWIIGLSPDNSVSMEYKSKSYNLKPEWRYIVNVGSIGQPRDHDPRACFVLWDSETNNINIRRIDYNIGLAQKKIMDAGLPEFLADRLSYGV